MIETLFNILKPNNILQTKLYIQTKLNHPNHEGKGYGSGFFLAGSGHLSADSQDPES